MAYPLNANEETRIARMRELRLLEDPDPALDRICEIARDVLSVPVATISFLDEKYQRLSNACGLGTDQTPREVAFCNYPVADMKPLIVRDALADGRFRDNQLVTGPPFIRFYAGMPLVLEPGLAIATFCCIDWKPRRLSEPQLKTLANLASLALAQIRLRKANLSLAWVSSHDWLTGLENRRGFRARLDDALVTAAAEGRKAALILVDLDAMKRVNDEAGHEAGDTLLKAAAQVLKDRFPGGAAARTGGDEFAVVLPGVASRDEAAAAAATLVSAFRAIEATSDDPSLPGLQGDCRASVGFSLFPDDAQDAAALLKAADLALYRAKKEGGDRFTAYAPEMSFGRQRVLSMHARARKAIVNGEVVPFYQPKIALGNGRVVGFEALLRLRGAAGLEPPAAIEAAFADPTLSVDLGRAMLAGVLEDMKGWQEEGVPFGSVALNVTEFEIGRGLSSHLLRRLSENGLAPSTLQVEVTEHVFLGRRKDDIAGALASLRAAGIQVALDDFGTGFASLTHLRELPVDWLKLDRSFVSDMDRDPKAASIVHGVISIAQSLGLGVVAEGLETGPQLELIRRRGCDLGQGYLFAKPMAGSRVPHFLKSWPGSFKEALPGPGAQAGFAVTQGNNAA